MRITRQNLLATFIDEVAKPEQVFVSNRNQVSTGRLDRRSGTDRFRPVDPRIQPNPYVTRILGKIKCIFGTYAGLGRL